MTIVNSVTPKAEAKQEFMFSKPASGKSVHLFISSIFFLSYDENLGSYSQHLIFFPNLQAQ